MSLKVLLFGQLQAVTNMFLLLQNQDKQTITDGIKTVNVIINDRQFIIFCISDRTLIPEQAIGTNALLFCLDSSLPLYEEKQFIYDLIKQKRQFAGLPLIIAFSQNSNFTIKDVINYFELFKVKDRPSMIKQINYEELQTITDTFKWIEMQNDTLLKSNAGFDAQPKVIKIKSKYREQQHQSTQKLYNQMLSNKQFKALGVKQQEKIYIDKEKQRMKSENMSKQLANFSKNKKMSPYEIKATQVPKIEANLHFFLKDPKNQKQPEVSIRIQTDDFKPKPKEKGYIPKKTGINEVRPILNILTTKALENASLQLEQEQQFAKMAKYKRVYNERVSEQKLHQKKNIEDQQALIRAKNKLVNEARIKNQQKQQIKCRVMCYSLGGKFVSGIYQKAIKDLYNRKSYKDTFKNELNTELIQQLMQATLNSHIKLQVRKTLIERQFDKAIVQPVLRQADGPKQRYKLQKQEKMKRRINSQDKQRVVSIYYQHTPPTFSNFSKYISRAFDGTLEQFVKSKEEQYQIIKDKIATQEVPQDTLLREKVNENIQFGKTHSNAALESQNSICFTVTSNRYEKTVKNVHKCGVMLNDENITNQSWLKFVNNLRHPKNTINMDQGLFVDLKNVPSNIRTLIFFSKLKNVQKYTQQDYAQYIKYASYGLQLYEYGLSIHRQDVGSNVRWQQIIKPVEGQQLENIPEQHSIVICYMLNRKSSSIWTYQSTGHVSKGMFAAEIRNYLQEVVHFRQRSLQIMRIQDDDEQLQPLSNDKKTGSKSKRNRSKKNIQPSLQNKTKMPPKIGSKILNPVILSLQSSIQQLQNKLEDNLKEWKEFIQSCEDGWRILVRGKPLQSNDQLKRVKKVGDIRVERLVVIMQQQDKIEDQKNEVNDRQQQNSN